MLNNIYGVMIMVGIIGILIITVIDEKIDDYKRMKKNKINQKGGNII